MCINQLVSKIRWDSPVVSGAFFDVAAAIICTRLFLCAGIYVCMYARVCAYVYMFVLDSGNISSGNVTYNNDDTDITCNWYCFQ